MSTIDEPPFLFPKFVSKSTAIQFSYGVWVSLVNIGIGLAFAFPLVIIPQLHRDSSSINFDRNQQSWIAHTLTLCAAMGCLINGYIADRYGRRVVLTICEVPSCVGWLYIAFASSTLHVLIGRAISGIGCGMAMGTPRTYISEISQPNMRGLIGVVPNVFISLGLVLQSVLGVTMSWRSACYVSAIFCALIGCANYFLHETPYYVLMTDDSDDNIMESLKRFRPAGSDINDELDHMLDFKLRNDIRRPRFIEQIKLIFSVEVCQPFCIVTIFLLITQLAGVTIIFFWTTDFLEVSNIIVKSEVEQCFVAFTRFGVGVCSAILTYKVGTKPQSIVSSLGVGITCLFLGTLLSCKVDLYVLVVACYVVFIIFVTLGYYTLPLTMMYELYPLQIRGLLGAISVSSFNIMIFGSSVLVSFIREAFGQVHVIFMFGVISVIEFFYLLYCVPETKNLTLPEIEEFFKNQREPRRNVVASQLSQASTRHIKNLTSRMHLK
ncbi:hypothetical protein ACJJTC_008896 [Scirpophaga incertulas]